MAKLSGATTSMRLKEAPPSEPGCLQWAVALLFAFLGLCGSLYQFFILAVVSSTGAAGTNFSDARLWLWLLAPLAGVASAIFVATR